jgi:hypothetical protein
LYKDYGWKCSVQNKITGRESQGAWRQEETDWLFIPERRYGEMLEPPKN